MSCRRAPVGSLAAGLKAPKRSPFPVQRSPTLVRFGPYPARGAHRGGARGQSHRPTRPATDAQVGSPRTIGMELPAIGRRPCKVNGFPCRSPPRHANPRNMPIPIRRAAPSAKRPALARARSPRTRSVSAITGWIGTDSSPPGNPELYQGRARTKLTACASEGRRDERCTEVGPGNAITAGQRNVAPTRRGSLRARKRENGLRATERNGAGDFGAELRGARGSRTCRWPGPRGEDAPEGTRPEPRARCPSRVSATPPWPPTRCR